MHWIIQPLMWANVYWQVSWWVGGKKGYQLQYQILDKLIMAKWCNGVSKYAFTLVWYFGETNMVQWCREYTQVHMVKW